MAGAEGCVPPGERGEPSHGIAESEFSGRYQLGALGGRVAFAGRYVHCSPARCGNGLAVQERFCTEGETVWHSAGTVWDSAGTVWHSAGTVWHSAVTVRYRERFGGSVPRGPTNPPP